MGRWLVHLLVNRPCLEMLQAHHSAELFYGARYCSAIFLTSRTYVTCKQLIVRGRQTIKPKPSWRY